MDSSDAFMHGAADAGAGGVLDELALAKIRQLDPDGRAGVFRKVLSTYHQSLSTNLPVIESAANGLQASELARVAHLLKSSSAAVGALAFATDCATVERLARAGWGPELRAAAFAMVAEGLRVQAAVGDMLRV